VFGLLRRWRTRAERNRPSCSFDAVLDLDEASLPRGVVPKAAMKAVTDRLAREAGVQRLRVRVRDAAAPMVLRLFAAGSTLEPEGEIWSALRERLLAGARHALAQVPHHDRPPKPQAQPGFAEMPAERFADGLEALAALAALATSVTSAPMAVRSSPATPLPASSDVDRLVRLLGFVLPGEDRATAIRALRRFGSYAAVLASPALELSQVQGLGPHSVAAIRLIHEAAIRFGRAAMASQPVLDNRARLTEYLAIALAHERIEQFRVLFLDSHDMLLADEVQARGTVNHTPVYPREVVRRALELDAKALVLVHNHPSGDPTPSREDIAMTLQVRLAASALEIGLRDHIIVGNGRTTSFREAGLLC
jgi:DNA repair protein RadC